MIKSLVCTAVATLTLHSSLQAAVSFEKQIWPIIESKCLECHKAPYEEDGRVKKPKVELRFDGAWAILKGSENGPVLTPGDAAKSYMHEVTTLPEHDDMFMPPKGDGLTQDEKDLLKTWINEGADFGDWVGNLEGKPADPEPATPKEAEAREHELFYTELAKGVEPAAEDALKAAEAAGAQVFQLQATSPLVRVDFLSGGSGCTDDKLAALLPLKAQVAQLDLGRTAITDAVGQTLGQLTHLAALDLRQTAIGGRLSTWMSMRIASSSAGGFTRIFHGAG